MTISELIVIVIGLIFGAGGTLWLTRRYDLRRANFRGQRIPAAAGLFFVLAGIWVYAYEWLTNVLDPKPPAAYLVVVFGFGMLGLLDDIGGDRHTGGYRGHFRALLRGSVTTGAAKAIGGGAVSLAAGFLLHFPSIGQSLLAAGLIALSANTLNLLDLRPGRCLFGFFVGAAVLILTLLLHHDGEIGFQLYIAVAAAVILFPLDALGAAMLGDTGANAFGAVLGVAGALFFSPLWQLVILVLLAGFQVWCERHSLSRTIDANPFLRGLDRKIGVR
jgi:UDP-N-acetylmuramyl pentapeptide phosphotransferase/UDP-N-acetylglucosamine-1-phosphate transferase